MKKFFSLTVIAAMVMSMSYPIYAADKTKGEPDVFVNDSKIRFEDQNAVIVNGVTLVPARGVFDALGCSVNWDEKTRTVLVTSETGVRDIVIKIDSDVMTVRTFKTIMNSESKEYKLEVPAQIMNERTMIPLRAVSEAMDCLVQWDSDAYAVNITKGKPILLEGAVPEVELTEKEKVQMSISSDADHVEKGEEFTVYMNLENIPDDTYLSGVVASFKYDKSKVEFVENSSTFLGDDDQPFGATVVVENTEYDIGTKVVAITIDEEKGRTKPGRVYSMKFKKLTDEDVEISLSNDFTSLLGYESYYQFSTVTKENVEDKTTIYSGDDLTIDKTPIVIK